MLYSMVLNRSLNMDVEASLDQARSNNIGEQRKLFPKNTPTKVVELRRRLEGAQQSRTYLWVFMCFLQLSEVLNVFWQ